MKRLFLFSSFDPGNRISEPLLNYLRHLAEFGDIVFVADNDLAAGDIAKIAPLTLYRAHGPHGEYDWGSYKRGFQWAHDARVLADYDRVYMLNDSMFFVTPPDKTARGVMSELFATLETADAGSVFLLKTWANNKFINKTLLGKTLWHSHMQSWFIGVSGAVAQSGWFNEFITGVTRQKKKKNIITEYEVGFSFLCRRHGLKIASFLSDFKNRPFREPLWLIQHGAPFIKKRALGQTDSKTNISEFKKLGAPETGMILDEIKRQIGDAEFAKLSARDKPYVYRRFGPVSVRRHYTPENKYVSDWYLFRWRIARLAARMTK